MRLGDEAERSSKFSPQRFDNGATKSASPTRSAGYITSSPFPAQSAALPVHGTNSQANYDGNQSTSSVDELSLGLRGMAVEDDYGAGQAVISFRTQQSHSVPPGPQTSQVRPPLPVQPQPPRPGYGAYPQADYSAYYATAAPGRDQFAVEYSYGYDTYRNSSDPTAMYGSAPAPNPAASPGGLYPSISSHPHPDMHRSPSGVFYEYNGAARATGSQFFYTPHQAMVYHPPPPAHSPMPNPQLTVAAASLNDKKRELQASV